MTCQLQHIDSTLYTNPSCINGILLVMHRRGWTSQMVNLINQQIFQLLHLCLIQNIHLAELKVLLGQKFLNIVQTTCIEVVCTYHRMSFPQETFAKVGADKAGSPCYQNTFTFHLHRFLVMVVITILQLQNRPNHLYRDEVPLHQ